MTLEPISVFAAYSSVSLNSHKFTCIACWEKKTLVARYSCHDLILPREVYKSLEQIIDSSLMIASLVINPASTSSRSLSVERVNRALVSLDQISAIIAVSRYCCNSLHGLVNPSCCNLNSDVNFWRVCKTEVLIYVARKGQYCPELRYMHNYSNVKRSHWPTELSNWSQPEEIWAWTAALFCHFRRLLQTSHPLAHMMVTMCKQILYTVRFSWGLLHWRLPIVQKGIDSQYSCKRLHYSSRKYEGPHKQSQDSWDTKSLKLTTLGSPTNNTTPHRGLPNN